MNAATAYVTAPSLAMRLSAIWWGVTACLLGVALAGSGAALAGAMIATALQALHFRLDGHPARSLPVQVRLAYLGLLLLGAWPPLAALHLLQFAATLLVLTYDYCPLARLLSLAPWNRQAPLSWRLLAWTLFSAPEPGNLLQRQAARFGAARGGHAEGRAS